MGLDVDILIRHQLVLASRVGDNVLAMCGGRLVRDARCQGLCST